MTGSSVKTKLKIFDILNFSLLTLICIIMFYPFLYLVSISTSNSEFVPYVTFYPKGFNLQAYRFIFSMPSVMKGYLNSVIYTSLYVFLSIALTTACAYPLSKKWLPGKNAFTVFIVFTMFFSGGLIPLYIVVKMLGLMNTMGAIIIPGALSAWLMIITRTFFQGIPSELEESCHVDGANELQIFTKIYLPLSKPILATLALFYAVAKWNSWFDAAIYLNDKGKYPIQLILRNLMVSTTAGAFDRVDMAQAYSSLKITTIDPNSLNYALTVAVVLPIIFVYPFAQKYFIKGVMIGSLKG